MTQFAQAISLKLLARQFSKLFGDLGVYGKMINFKQDMMILQLPTCLIIIQQKIMHLVNYAFVILNNLHVKCSCNAFIHYLCYANKFKALR